jgi:retinoblastoma-like protein 1
VRLADICARLHVSQEVTRNAFQICEFVVFEKTSLLYSRHLDQIILASIYGACKIASNDQDRNVKFKDVVYRYHKQPQCVEEVFWSCPLTVTNPGLEVVSRGDIIAFYNKQFVPNVKPFMLQLRKGGGESLAPTTTKSQKATPKRPLKTGITAPAVQGTPSRSRVPFDSEALLKSPIREVKGNAAGGNVYVSPMRPETREKAVLMRSSGADVDENTNNHHRAPHVASPSSFRGRGDVGAPKRKSPSSAAEKGVGNIVALVGQTDFHEINQTLSQKSKE